MATSGMPSLHGLRELRLLAGVRIGWAAIWLVQLGYWGTQVWTLGAFPQAAWMPLWMFQWRVGIPSVAYGEGLWLVALLGTLLVAAGWRTRYASAVAFASGTLLGGLLMGFGKVNHSSQLPLLVLLVFQFSPWARAWSLDARRAARAGEPTAPSEWPYKVVIVVAGLMYLSSASLKFLRGAFLHPHYLSEFITTQSLDAAAFGYPTTPWRDALVAWLLRHPALTDLLAIAAILLEATILLGAFGRRPRAFAFAAILALHAGIGLVGWLAFPLQQLTALLLLMPTVLLVRSGEGDLETQPSPRRPDEVGSTTFWATQVAMIAGASLVLLACSAWIEGTTTIDPEAGGRALRPLIDFLVGPWFSLLGLIAGSAGMAWMGASLAASVARRLRPPAADGQRRVFLFDGDCGLCQRWVAWARRRHPVGVEFQPCQGQAELRHEAGIPDDDCMRSAFFVRLREGRPVRVARASSAIHAVLARAGGWRGAGWRAVSLTDQADGLREIQAIGYGWIARNRHRLIADGEACEVPGAAPTRQPDPLERPGRP